MRKKVKPVKAWALVPRDIPPGDSEELLSDLSDGMIFGIYCAHKYAIQAREAWQRIVRVQITPIPHRKRKGR